MVEAISRTSVPRPQCSVTTSPPCAEVHGSECHGKECPAVDIASRFAPSLGCNTVVPVSTTPSFPNPENPTPPSHSASHRAVPAACSLPGHPFLLTTVPMVPLICRPTTAPASNAPTCRFAMCPTRGKDEPQGCCPSFRECHSTYLGTAAGEQDDCIESGGGCCVLRRAAIDGKGPSGCIRGVNQTAWDAARGGRSNINRLVESSATQHGSFPRDRGYSGSREERIERLQTSTKADIGTCHGRCSEGGCSRKATEKVPSRSDRALWNAQVAIMASCTLCASRQITNFPVDLRRRGALFVESKAVRIPLLRHLLVRELAY